MAPITSSWSIEEKNYNENFNKKVLPWVRGFKVKMFKGIKEKKLAYMCFQKKGALKAIVISNGRTEYISKYFELAYDIYHSNLNVSVCLYDHRGQGLSERILADPRKGHVEDFNYYVDDFAKIIKLVKSMGHTDVYVWGQSMGGGIAIRTAQKHQNLISGMILFSPLLGLYTKPLPNWLADGIAKVMTWLNMGERFIPGTTYYKVDPSIEGLKNNQNIRSLPRWTMTENFLLPSQKEWAHETIGGGTVHFLHQILKTVKAMAKDAHKVTIPTLLIQAGDDAHIDPKKQDSFCKRAKNCKLYTFNQEKYRNKEGSLPLHELFMDYDNIRNEVLQRSFQFMKDLGVQTTTSD